MNTVLVMTEVLIGRERTTAEDMILCKVSRLPWDAAEPNGLQLEELLLEATGPGDF